MKKITCFTESLAGGGAEHQITILASLLSSMNYDVTLTTYAPDQDHYTVPTSVKRKRLLSGKNKIDSFLHITWYFLTLKTDCIISYRQRCNVRALIPLLLRRKIKVICSERNATLTKPSFHEKLLFSFLYRRADYIVSNSKTQTSYISERSPFLISKLRTIHNYTDLEHYKKSLVPRDISIIKIAVFSRFSPQKNPLLFVKAMSVLKQSMPKPCKVYWFGNQYNSNGAFSVDFERFKSAIAEFGVEDILIIKPSIKDTAVVMNDFHALCLPSLFEGFSNSIAEGICSGKPMLVSNVSDNAIMVHEGENGFLFDPHDVNSICNSFLHFLTLTYDEMVEMADKSRTIAESLFEKSQFINSYLELIES